MSYRVTHYEGAALAAVHLSGTVRWPDLEAALRALYEHPAWVPGSAALWDARGVTALDVTPADLQPARAALAEVAAARAGGRVAIVAGSAIHAGVLGTLAQLGPPTGRRVGAYLRLEDALGFLGRFALPDESDVTAAASSA